jgi:hypothetical protein
MSRICVGLVLVVLAVSMGCSCGGGGSAESVAKGFLDATKSKNVDAMVKYVDLKGIYESLPEAAKKDMPFEEFKKQTVEAMKKGAEADKDKKFDYKNLKVTEEGDTATVTVETTDDGETWKTDTVKLTKIGGKWMLGADAMGGMTEQEMPEMPEMPDMPDMPDMDN